jgi:uncharacterized lipoprotein
MRKFFALLTVTAAALLGACAQSPQQLTVRPVLEISGEAWGNGQHVLVTAKDQRASRVVGTLGGVYGNSTTITIANSLEDAMVRASNALLASKGFVVNSNDPNAVRLNVVIDSLRWEDVTEDDKVGKAVKMTAALRAEATRGGETFSGRYQTATDYRGVTRPSMKQNEQRINDLLEATLLRMFDDHKLRDFLLQAAPAGNYQQGYPQGGQGGGFNGDTGGGVLQGPVLLP